MSNDHNSYAHTLATCYVQANREDWAEHAESVIEELNALAPKSGFITETYCERSRYFQPENGRKIDAIRDEIEKRQFDPELKAILLTSLIEAADRVDSTTGLQMAYLKSWAARASKPLILRLPDLTSGSPAGKSVAYSLEADVAARQLEADLAYLDPPYNQHSYLGNYHVWETIVRWDEPEVYGIACKRVDCRERKSPFNSRGQIKEALRNVVESIKAKHLLVSFNNEGFLTRDDLEEILSVKGTVTTLEIDYKRYVGAKIGIHNLKGERVGKVGHLNNKELLFSITP